MVLHQIWKTDATSRLAYGKKSSRQMNELIPHTNSGSGADIGAFEVGESWTTGINWTPKFHTTIWKKTAATTDWNTASNWSTGYVPTSDVHWMGYNSNYRCNSLSISKFH